MNRFFALILIAFYIGNIHAQSTAQIGSNESNYQDMRIKDFSTYLYGTSTKGSSLANTQIKYLSDSDLSYLLREKYYTDVVLIIAIQRIRNSELKIYRFSYNEEDSANQRKLIRELLIVDDYQWDINPKNFKQLKEHISKQLHALQIPDYIKDHFTSYEPKRILVNRDFKEKYQRLIDADTASHVHGAFEMVRKIARAIQNNTPVFIMKNGEEMKIDTQIQLTKFLISDLQYSKELEEINKAEKKL